MQPQDRMKPASAMWTHTYLDSLRCFVFYSLTSWLPHFLISWVPNFLTRWLSVYPDILTSWFHYIPIPWLPDILTSWFPDILTSWFPDFLISYFPNPVTFFMSWYPDILISMYHYILISLHTHIAGLDFLFHMFFLSRYCKLLEETSFRGRTADFFFMLVFGGALLTVVAPFVNIQFLGQSLTFMMVSSLSSLSSFIRSFNHSSIHWYIYSFIHLFIYAFVHSFIMNWWTKINEW